MVFFFLLAVPLVLAIAGFIVLGGITRREFLAQVGAQLAIAGISAAIIYQANTSDTEIWNGYVTSKKQVRVSCSHSYRCNCHEECSGSGSERSCHEECDTCYEHSNDWDWDVFNSIDETFTIDRVDRRGSEEPLRWTAVGIGEPTSRRHGYTNYIKAAPDTLFRHQGLKEKYLPWIPEYPDDVHDYYRLNRLVLVNGATVADAGAWNEGLSVLNGMLGHNKQANMIIVLAKGLPADYFYALEEAWVGAKKNDTVLVIGVDGKLAPKWAVVMAWTLNELFKIKLRDDVMDLPTLTKDGVLNALSTNVTKFYQRKPMAEFEYLTASITPTTAQWLVSLILGLMVAGGLTYWFHREDVFDERWRETHTWKTRKKFYG